MRFEVMRRHIDKGFPVSPRYCPIARAMTEQMGIPIGITKGKAWNMQTGEVIAVLPEYVVKTYIKYDHTGFMKPFSFDLEEEASKVFSATA